MKPLEHAKLNAETYGGVAADYIKIHEVMDSSKQGLGDKRHRACYHQMHFVHHILPMIFGSVLTNSDGKQVSVSQIGEDHLTQDFGDHGLAFLPTISDYLANMPMQPWMDNGREYPPSRKALPTVKLDVSVPFPGGDINKKLEDLKKEILNKSLEKIKEVDWANVQLDGATKKYRELQALKKDTDGFKKLEIDTETEYPVFYSNAQSD